MSGYQNLVVWQRTTNLITDIYLSTATYPMEERFGLQAQMRRAAISIASNIAEGRGRRTKPEFLQFIGNARGSCLELEAQILVSRKLSFLSETDEARLLERAREVARLLNGLVAYLRRAT